MTADVTERSSLGFSNQTMEQTVTDWIVSSVATLSQHKPSVDIKTFVLFEHRSTNKSAVEMPYAFSVFCYMDFIITSPVPRLITEQTLYRMSTTGEINDDFINLTVRPLSYQTITQLRMVGWHINANDDCAETNPASGTYRPVMVSELMICEYIIFSSGEYILDKDNLSITIIQFGLTLYVPEFNICNGSITVCYDKVRSYLHPSLQSAESILNMLTNICLISSEICLLITFITYLLFHQLRTLPGQINMSLVFCLICAQFCTISLSVIDKKDMLCILIGLSSHFFWLSVFMWLNTCSFHIFILFGQKNIQKSYACSSKDNNRRFAFYSLYSFGIPSVLVMSNVVTSLTLNEYNNYGYGLPYCFIDNRTAFIITLLVPMICVCAINVCFFVVTAWRLTTMPTIRKSNSDRSDFLICVKLFVLTGLTWVLQVFDSFAGRSALTYIATVCNGLQGVFIFLSYVCNRRVFNMYKNIFIRRVSRKLDMTDGKET